MPSGLLLRARILMGAAISLVPSLALSETTAPKDFLMLAQTCAPSVDASTLGAVAKVESGFDAWALHDNTTGQREDAASLMQAETDAGQWLSHGDSVDVGLMQINSANFSALGLTVESALNPCSSLTAGAAILRAAFGGGDTPADQQVALLMALSRYNTGSPLRGIMNGYAHKVMVNFASANEHNLPTEAAIAPFLAMSGPGAPAAWNVSDTGSYEETHGAPWLISLPSNVQPPSSVR